MATTRARIAIPVIVVPRPNSSMRQKTAPIAPATDAAISAGRETRVAVTGVRVCRRGSGSCWWNGVRR